MLHHLCSEGREKGIRAFVNPGERSGGTGELISSRGAETAVRARTWDVQAVGFRHPFGIEFPLLREAPARLGTQEEAKSRGVGNQRTTSMQ